MINPNEQQTLRILIVADNASAKFGGEAILPLHYFRLLLGRNEHVQLLVHERCKKELREIFPDNQDVIHYISDTFCHRWLWRFGKLVPYRVRNFTTELASNLLTQFMQQRLVKYLIVEFDLNIIHQPTPVSPKQPSMLFGLKKHGHPKIIIGPMNGGMDYPAAFKKLAGLKRRLESAFIRMARPFASCANMLLPGKKQADLLLVANQRTYESLPSVVCHDEQKRVGYLSENAVFPEYWPAIDWQSRLSEDHDADLPTIKVVFLGRLQYLKAVDTVIDAIDQLHDDVVVKMDVIGDGEARTDLETQVLLLDLCEQIHFRGFVPQHECSELLASADVLVLPSIHECGGAVVLEAMCMQLPVIVADWGGPADYVTAACGFKISVASRQALVDGIAQSLQKLAQDPKLCEKMGVNGRQRVLKEFNWHHKIEQMLDLYRQ